MTITTDVSKVTVNGNGSGTVFSFSPVTIFNTGDLLVTKVDSAGVETELSEGVSSTTYSVQITNPNFLPSIGTVTYPASGGSPLAIGESLVIKRQVDLVQNTNLRNQGGYFPEVQEAAFDYNMMADIQQQEEIDRSIKIPTHITGVDVNLPNPVAGQILAWNGTATGLISTSPSITADISTSLVVVSGVAPGLVDGRIWIDTSVANQRVIRICDGSDYNEIIRFSTINSDLTIVEPVTHNEEIIINLTNLDTAISVTSADDTASEGPSIELIRNSASPAANDLIGVIRARGKDTAANTDTFSKISTKIIDPTSTSEDGELIVATMASGTLADRLKIGAGIYTPAQTDKGTNSINASSLYMAGTLMAASDVSIQSGTTHSPVLLDHGKTFIYTNPSGCTVTLPAASGLFAGWHITVHNLAATSHVIINRSSTDFIHTRTSDLTTIRLPSVGDGGTLILNSTGGGAQFIYIGKRSFESTEIALTASTTSTIAHNLGVIPTLVNVFLRNKTGELGYNVNDEINIGNGGDRGGAQRNYQLTMDATNGVFQIGTTATVGILNKTTPAAWVSVTTPGNWRHFWRAEVIN